MSIELTEEQRQAVRKGEPVRVPAPEIGEDVVLLRAAVYEEIRELLADEREQQVFRAFARKQAARLAKENPY
jgi:hypothetical protein